MGSLILNCKIITPIFCYGADGNTPELRAPSLKGVLRFWWRAIRPDLSLKELKEKETEIFGGAGDEEARKSRFSLQISNIRRKEGEIQALPHKKLFTKKAIMPDSTFDIIIKPKNEEIKNLLIFTSILGGIGARNRRGFGCFQIESIDENKFDFMLNKDSLIDLIKEINPNFEIGKEYNRNYPYLQKVEIGEPTKDYNELLKKIGQASHKFPTPYTGSARNGRYASPIYVSVFKKNSEFYPIISTLKRTINDTRYHEKDEKNKNNFIQAILGGE